MKYLSEDFGFFWKKIINRENFAFMRMADGERMLMLGEGIDSQEHWHAPDSLTKLGKDLYDTLSLTNDNVYYAISCPCCDQEAYFWYLSRVKNKNITFSNLWINANYMKFINEFEKIHYDAVVICNKNGYKKPIGNLNILDYFCISDECVDFYENNFDDFINEIFSKYGKSNNLLFVISAGPLSQLIIYKLYLNNPNNMYIDFGSALNKYIHGYDTRPYNNPNNKYAKKNCYMYDIDEINTDISVILTSYKKPESLSIQLNALLNQSIKPKEIILYQDKIEDDNYNIVFTDEILSKFDITIISNKNCGVWKRFELAKKCKYELICIFDDDTIPGTRWLENCYTEYCKEEGIYTTIGIILEEPKYYAYKGYYRVGWDNPCYKKCMVDFGGHSWFFNKKYLDYMFDNTKKYQDFKYAAEDMTLSFKCKENGINTFVPKHPFNEEKLWGSLKKYALKYGQAPTAISLNTISCDKFNVVINMFINDGHKFLVDENFIYVKTNKFLLKF